jgi:hypothetical protein
MPYTLQLYSKGLREVTLRLEGDIRLRLEEIIALFRSVSKADDDYERMWFLAYLYGMWKNWPLAERYCQFALDVVRDDKEKAIHEGLFLMAVCMRHSSQLTPQVFRDAIKLIQQAGKIKSESKKDADYADPRYLKEEGLNIFLWHALVDRGKVGNRECTDLRPPPLSRAIKLHNLALKRIRDDRRLRVGIYNNLCYHYLTKCDARSRAMARDAYRSFVEEQELIEPDKKKWMPDLLDTYCWGAWLLEESAKKRERCDELIGLLTYASTKGGLELDEQGRKAVAEHLKTIELKCGQ